MSGEQSSPEDLKDLENRLRKMRGEIDKNRADKNVQPHPAMEMIWLAFHVISELLGGVVCGLAIGWELDKWLKTRPLFIAVFLILGCIAAVLNVVRYLKRHDEKKRKQ